MGRAILAAAIFAAGIALAFGIGLDSESLGAFLADLRVLAVGSVVGFVFGVACTVFGLPRFYRFVDEVLESRAGRIADRMRPAAPAVIGIDPPRTAKAAARPFPRPPLAGDDTN